MADKSKKQRRNVSGIFYVDKNCNDCDLCWHIAPMIFKRSETRRVANVFVKKQPENKKELALCRKAMKGCGMNAIGDDGDAAIKRA